MAAPDPVTGRDSLAVAQLAPADVPARAQINATETGETRRVIGKPKNQDHKVVIENAQPRKVPYQTRTPLREADQMAHGLGAAANSHANDAATDTRRHAATTSETIATEWWLLGFLLLAAPVVAWVATVVHRHRIVTPLRALVAGAERLARGDLSTDIPVRSNDEIGHLTDVFNLMRKKLSQNLALLNCQKHALDEHSIVSIADIRGNIIFVNDKFCEISGYTREELIGQDHRFDRSREHSLDFYRELWSTISNGDVWSGIMKNRKKDGSPYWVDATIVPFRNEHGLIHQFVAIRTDVTDRVRYEKQLRQAKAEAEAADLAKSEFLANMSHEIRTPMTAILGFAENILDADQSDSEKLSCARTIRRNGEYLLELVNDILDLSKIEAGKMTVELTHCQPCRIVAEVAKLMRVQAEAKGLPLNIEYIGAIPETIHSDAIRLRQILINLIGNAIKFTDVGTVRLVTRLVDRGDAPCLQFDVIDTGCGMTKAQEAKLFQPFVQAETSTARQFGGTGLGLTISKRFAELLGGDITVAATEMGVGTTFRATVATGPVVGVKMLDDPMSATRVVEAADASDRVSPEDLHGCRILLAEDSPDSQRLISYILKKAGGDVVVTENGKLSLDAALAARDADDPFDVILMDMQMPIMDGYEATEQLRRNGYTKSIVALTAGAMGGDHEKCINAGCDDYATKPIDRAKLIETVRRHWVGAAAAAPATAR